MSRLFILLFFCSTFGLSAQDEDLSFFDSIALRGKLGLNINNHYGDVVDATSPRFDLHLGGLVQASLSTEWKITGEVLYSREGYNPANDDSGALKVKLEFLNIFGLANYKLGKNWSLDFGPMLAVKISESSEDDEKEKTDRYKPIRLGIGAGSTYQINDSWQGQARLIFKPNSLIKQEASDNEGTTSLMLQFSVVYTLF